MRLIDADAFKQQAAAETVRQGLNVEKIAAFCMLVDMQPTIDPVRHARWTMDGRCTACDGFEPCDDEGSRCSSDFCPDCGARIEIT